MSAKKKFTYENDGKIGSEEPKTVAPDKKDSGNTAAEPKKADKKDAAISDNKPEKIEKQKKEVPAKKAADKQTGGAKEKPVKKESDKQKVKKSGWLIAVASLLVVITVISALGFSGILNLNGLLASFGVGNSSGATYDVDNRDALLIYLKHPSFKSGDTINLLGSFVVDVDTDFDGFAEIPLVSFVGNGSITFTGGIVFMSGDANVDLSKATFTNTTLYIEAPDSNITAGSISDTYINAAKLNGTSHRQELDLAFPGTRMTVPVVFENLTDSALENVKISLASPSFIFVEGNTYILDSIPANGTVTQEIPVVATEAGRLLIFAYSVDSDGNTLVTGQSDFINIFGPGYYSGDIHTHTDFSRSVRYGTIPGNIKAGYDHGLSFIVSVENELEAEQYTQAMVDNITGNPGVFEQYTAYESGPHNRHLLIYNTDVRPATNYGEAIDGYGMWTYQAAINEVLSAGGIPVMAHFFNHGEITTSIELSKSSRGAHIETLCNTHKYRNMDAETECALNVWNAQNVAGNRMYGIMTSNNIYPEDVGNRFIKGYMANLSEENLYKILTNGNFYSSNGPEIRFELGGMQMGEELVWGLSMMVDPDAQTIEGEETPMIVDPNAKAATATATIHASDIYPLTTVRLIKYEITGKMDSENPIVIYEKDLTGQGIYSYYEEIDVELGDREFIRLEVLSEQAHNYDDIGVALSNPIWISSGAKDNYSTISSISNILGAEIKTAPNGINYITSSLGIVPGLVQVSHDGQKVTVNYHSFNSDKLVDYITVDVLTDAGTHTVEKIYIV